MCDLMWNESGAREPTTDAEGAAKEKVSQNNLNAVDRREKYSASLLQSLTLLKINNNNVDKLHKKDHCKAILSCCYKDHTREDPKIKLPELRALVKAAILREPEKLRAESPPLLDHENNNS